MVENLELLFFGNLVFRKDGETVREIKSRKAQALLCYLAVTGQSHSRSALAGLLWGGMSESRARMNLSQALTTLRRSFSDHLTITRQRVAFDKESGSWVDVIAFKAAVTEASVDGLHKAVRLYQGDFLDGFYVHNAPEFETWTLIERAQLRELVLDSLHRLVEFHSEHGQSGWEKAIECGKRLLTIEPWHEEIHRQLIRLLALSGRRSAALIQYEKCRQILLADLGVEPSEETAALYNSIRNETFPAGEAIPELSKDKGGIITKSHEKISERVSIASNLPPRLTKFVGREFELGDLNELIVNRGTRLATLVGPGGIGKTSLALEFAAGFLPQTTQGNIGEVGSSHPFPDGVFFIPLESVPSSDLIIPSIADALRFRIDHGESQLLEYLQSKKLLLIVDNFEHLLENGELLSRILTAAAQVRILVTSREKLNLHEEQVFPLQGLTLPDSFRSSFEIDYSAGKLFLEAARRQHPGFSLSGRDHEDLACICQLVEGMPLAIELAATWTNILPLSDIASEIQSNIDFLATEFRNLPARHRSVRAVFDVSWNQLLPGEQSVFSQLAVFRSGFSREAALAITDATIEMLSILVGKSMLRYRKSQDRYYIHELLRNFAAEKINSPTDEMEELHERHSQYYCKWFEDQGSPENLKSIGQKFALDQMKVELENTRTAWVWALQNQGENRLILGLTAIGRYYIWRGGYLDGERTFQEFANHLAGAEKSTNGSRMLLRARILNWLGFFVYELGSRKEAVELLLESQDLLNSPSLDQMDTRAERAHNIMNLTRADWSLGNDIRSEHVSQAMALYREVDHSFGLPYALSSGGRLAILAGRFDEARHFLVESLEIYMNTGNQIGRAISLTGLGNLAFARNEYDEAERLLQQSVEISTEVDSFERIIIASLYRGTTKLYSGHFKQAKRILDQCVVYSIDRGLTPLQATAQSYLGNAWLHLGEYDQAIECSKAALPLAEQTTDEEVISQCIMLQAAADLANRSFTRALNGFEKVNKFQVSRRSARVVFGEDCGQVGLGTALLQQGRMDEAREVYSTMLQQAVADHRQDKLLFALVGIALHNARLGKTEQAVEIYSLAGSYPFVGNSRWFQDVFGLHIETARENLPKTRAELAALGGQNRDLWGTASELLLDYGET
jgi:DNA-binding SARP family transcriptional activator/predicted ATPase